VSIRRGRREELFEIAGMSAAIFREHAFLAGDTPIIADFIIPASTGHGVPALA
jgi:hypothetical protein